MQFILPSPALSLTLSPSLPPGGDGWRVGEGRDGETIKGGEREGERGREEEEEEEMNSRLLCREIIMKFSLTLSECVL